MLQNDHGFDQLPALQDQKVDAPLPLIFRMGQGACLSCFKYRGGQYIKNGEWRTVVGISRLGVGYLNATINRTTWKPELAIGTQGVPNPGETRGSIGRGPGLDCQDAAGRGFGQFLNQIKPF